MKYLQHCFIRKNTPELHKKLKELGYRHNDLDDGKGKWLAANHGMFISVDKGFERLPLEDIDCGTNEELFLALAALNCENDYMQWFICMKEYLGIGLRTVRVGEWQCCTEHYRISYSLSRLWRKATAREIVEHFKKTGK